ncbi:nuclear pore complex protein Nup88 [Lycorma delicatula]|uniref:nuclear pore complex protein Nup88 n=1 Tax=Lycorma delicatula TaxID=130591 RepID=UPI003F51408B
MASSADRLKLSETEWYKLLSDYNFGPNLCDPRNILEFAEDVLYAWDHKQLCLSVLLTKFLMVEDAVKTFQKLIPTTVIDSEVFKLALNFPRRPNKIAIVCKHDVYNLTLPPRSGPDDLFKGGTTDISCRCRKLNINEGTTDILQVDWHPGSDYENHLVILTDDNVIQIYDVSSYKCITSWILNTASPNRLPSVESVGENVVDFQFIPHSSLKYIPPRYPENKNEPMEWPVLLLRGNGDVIMLDLPVSSEKCKVARMTSPLLMFPSAEDNYGVDCSGILVLNGPLPIVVIASSTGILYHCMLLNLQEPDYQNYENKNTDDVSGHFEEPQYALHVIESVELDIGFNLEVHSEETGVEITSSPLKLVRDATVDTRYFIIHAAGLHSVNLPIMQEFKIYFSKNYEPSELPPHALLDFKRDRSVVEYTVCSQMCGTKPCPVVGAVCIECPTSTLVTLFPDEIISLQLTTWYISPGVSRNPFNKYMVIGPVANAVDSPPFQDFVKKILRPDNKSTPVFKMADPANPSPQQSLELLARATSYFREVAIPRQEQAAEFLRIRTIMLTKMKQQQHEDLKLLINSKASLQISAEHLAEKYEDINEKQINLYKRAEHILVNLKTMDKGLTRSEKSMYTKLIDIQSVVNKFQEQIKHLRLREVSQNRIMQNWLSQNLKELYMPDSHVHILSNSFSNMTTDIRNLTDQVQAAEYEIDFDINLNRALPK